MPDLISSLLAQPQRFDLFQALHLIERAHAGRMPVGSSLGLDEAVRLSSPVSLGFVPSDIVAVCPSTRPGPPLTLSSAVMALAGAQGPLPLPFTEMVIDDARRSDRAAMAFLDIFHQRLLGFLYRSRRRHHVALTQGSLKTSPVMRALDALSGLGHAEGARGPDGQRAWFRHAGLQGAAPRSMASLLAVVRDRLGIALEGRSFVGAWHPLADEERARLSARPARVAVDRAGLGIGVALGARAWDPGAGIALSTPPLEPAQFEAFLPGGSTHGLLAWLVARHLQQDMRVQLQVAIAHAPATRVVTRRPAGAGCVPRLGMSAWLTGPARPTPPLPSALPVLRLQSARFFLAAQGPVHGH
jgi:type VI secretion system protein ImpH